MHEVRDGLSLVAVVRAGLSAPAACCIPYLCRHKDTTAAPSPAADIVLRHRRLGRCATTSHRPERATRIGLLGAMTP